MIEKSYPSFSLLYDVRFHTNSSVLRILTITIFAILYLFCFVFCDSGFHKSAEQRMRTVRTGFELRMCRSDKEWMIRKLYHLHNTSVRRNAGEHHAVFGQHFAIIVVKLITMTMALLDRLLAVKPVSERRFIQHTRIRTKA